MTENLPIRLEPDIDEKNINVILENGKRGFAIGGAIELKRNYLKSMMSMWLGSEMTDSMLKEWQTEICNRYNSSVKWQPIDTAPRETTFIIRHKARPQVQLEASLQFVQNIDDLGNDGWLLCNETYEDDIFDDHWDNYEWTAVQENV